MRRSKFSYNYYESDEEGYAHFMGLLFSDGSFASTKDSVYIKSTDLDIIEKHKLRSGYTGNVLSEGPRRKGWKSCYCLQLYGQHARWYKENNNYNCDKEYHSFRTLRRPIKDMSAFLRGFLEGDGIIRVDKCSTGWSLHEVKFLGRELLIDEIRSYLGGGIKSLYQTKNKDLYYLRFVGIEAKNLLDFVYKDATIYMNRKYKEYLKVKNWVPHSQSNIKSDIPGLSYDASLSKPWRYRKYRDKKKIIDKTFKTQEDAEDYISSCQIKI